MTLHNSRIFSLTRAERYAIAVFGVILTAIVRFALNPVLKDQLPFFLFVIPVIVACWSGGLGTGLLATGLSLALGGYLFIKPTDSVFDFQKRHAIGAVAFAFTGIAFSILFDRIRKE